LDRFARFIPPRRQLRRQHGEFAAHARLRARIAALAGQPIALPHELSLSAQLATVIGAERGRLRQILPPLPEPNPPCANPLARLVASGLMLASRVWPTTFYALGYWVIARPSLRGNTRRSMPSPHSSSTSAVRASGAALHRCASG